MLERGGGSAGCASTRNQFVGNIGLFLRAHAPPSLIAPWFSVKTLFASSIEQHWAGKPPKLWRIYSVSRGTSLETGSCLTIWNFKLLVPERFSTSTPPPALRACCRSRTRIWQHAFPSWSTRTGSSSGAHSVSGAGGVVFAAPCKSPCTVSNSWVSLWIGCTKIIIIVVTASNTETFTQPDSANH